MCCGTTPLSIRLIDDDPPKCSACGLAVATQTVVLEERESPRRTTVTWSCECGSVSTESRTNRGRERPPHRRGICWIAWDPDSERYVGYLGELDQADAEIAHVENTPTVRDLDKILAWAREAASVVIVRPEFDPSTHYSAGERRAGRRGLPTLPPR